MIPVSAARTFSDWWPIAARDLLEDPAAPAGCAALALPPHASAARSARGFAVGTLRGWGLRDLTESMELVVSELAANALRHGLARGGASGVTPVLLSLVRRGSLVTCAFTDPGAKVPALRYAGPLEAGGLGLHIVNTLSRRWGWSALAPKGKIVWAVLSRRE